MEMLVLQTNNKTTLMLIKINVSSPLVVTYVYTMYISSKKEINLSIWTESAK